MFDKRQYLIKERVGFLKLTDVYDIFDPETGQQIGIAVERPPTWATWLRLIVNKSALPTRIEIAENTEAPPQLAIERGFTLLRSKVNVLDASGQQIGYFKSKLVSLGGAFYVYDKNDNQVAMVKGDWKGWNFRFLTEDQQELGLVTKKWSGLGKELLTSADNYMISVHDSAPSAVAALLIAAGLAIDIIFKESK